MPSPCTLDPNSRFWPAVWHRAKPPGAAWLGRFMLSALGRWHSSLMFQGGAALCNCLVSGFDADLRYAVNPNQRRNQAVDLRTGSSVRTTPWRPLDPAERSIALNSILRPSAQQRRGCVLLIIGKSEMLVPRKPSESRMIVVSRKIPPFLGSIFIHRSCSAPYGLQG